MISYMNSMVLTLIGPGLLSFSLFLLPALLFYYRLGPKGICFCFRPLLYRRAAFIWSIFFIIFIFMTVSSSQGPFPCLSQLDIISAIIVIF
ncbi:hypothetical protein BJX61DRAFT_147057 [Aspergillus egyptiacus]|nr:hypothetical protein BJX61DRAFT_147057 [Aspergillus egyptiacus]